MTRQRRRRKAKAPDENWTGQGRAILIGLGVALGAFLVGYALTATIFFPSIDGDGIVTVPDLRGQPEADARALLDRQGLVLETGQDLDHPSVPAGAVLVQSPMPGTEVLPGFSVRVTLSAGQSRRPVPDVRGLSARAAGDALERIGFQVRISEVEDQAIAGRILDIQPRPGTMVEIPAMVQLTVSIGPPRVSVPELVGMTEGEARRALSEVGLALGAVEFNRFSLRPRGTVTAQRPSPGVELRAGSAVAVTVAGRSAAPMEFEPHTPEEFDG